MDRVQGNLIARAERRLLDRLCRAMPAWMTPDRLTALGAGGAAMVLAGYALSPRHTAWLWLAIAGYAVHWFGDSLDGSLARARGIARPRYGFVLDHSVDALGNTAGMVGLGLTRFVRLDIALLALVGYLLMTVHVLLRARVEDRLQLSFAALGPTELRLLLVALTLAMLAAGGSAPHIGPWSFYDACTLGMALGLAVTFIWHSAVLLRRLRAEP
jgi:phosphatidylglycerophosphate synthase